MYAQDFQYDIINTFILAPVRALLQFKLPLILTKTIIELYQLLTFALPFGSGHPQLCDGSKDDGSPDGPRCGWYDGLG